MRATPTFLLLDLVIVLYHILLLHQQQNCTWSDNEPTPSPWHTQYLISGGYKTQRRRPRLKARSRFFSKSPPPTYLNPIHRYRSIGWHYCYIVSFFPILDHIIIILSSTCTSYVVLHSSPLLSTYLDSSGAKWLVHSGMDKERDTSWWHYMFFGHTKNNRNYQTNFNITLDEI